MVVEYADARGPWFVMPGGGQKQGETLHECLLREVEEEVGLRVDVGPLLCVREVIADRLAGSLLPAGFHQVEVFFRCSLCSEHADATPTVGDNPDPGQAGAAWIELDRLRHLRFFPEGLATVLADPSWYGGYLGATN